MLKFFISYGHCRKNSLFSCVPEHIVVTIISAAALYDDDDEALPMVKIQTLRIGNEYYIMAQVFFIEPLEVLWSSIYMVNEDFGLESTFSLSL